MKNEQIARVIHEVSKSYCLAIGDDTQLSWEDSPEWLKSSVINGVDFHINNPDAGPDNSHNEWLREKEENGWRYGPVKNASKKEHPCFVPYDSLPVEQKAKDFIFISIVHELSK